MIVHANLTALIGALLLVTTGLADEAAVREKDTITNSIGMKLKLIESGEFQMGSLDEVDNPPREVRIAQDFYLGVTEVTQAQWEAVMGSPGPGTDFVKKGGPKFPAMFIGWHDAVDFCRELSKKEGVTYRLPTEAEWEYACRAGTKTRFSFGDDESKLPDYAWYGWVTRDGSSKGEEYAHEVATKLPNPWGLYDMHGNAWEWCEGRAPVRGPKSRDEEGRVVRGGNWYDHASWCRSSLSAGWIPEGRGIREGFRVVREVDKR